MLKGTRAAEYDQKCVSTRDWTMLVRKLRLAIGPGKERLLLLAIYMVVEMKIGGWSIHLLSIRLETTPSERFRLARSRRAVKLRQ